MKKQSIQDERVKAQRNKINSEVSNILMFALLISIPVQQYLFNAPFEQYAFEFILVLGVSFYTIARYIMLGLNIYGEGKRAKHAPVLIGAVVGISVTAVNGYFNYRDYSEHYQNDNIIYFFGMLIVTFISASLAVFFIMTFFDYINKKRQEKIQKSLDEEEMED